MASNSTSDAGGPDRPLPNPIDALEIPEKEKEEIKKWAKEKDKGRIEILIVGRTGVGKSTLVNALIGEEVAKVGTTLRSETMHVIEYKRKVEGVEVIVWDSPGLQDSTGNDMKYLDELKDKCRNVDIVVYCINLSAQRSEFAEEQNEMKAITELTKTFGKHWWEHSMFVMTMANTCVYNLSLQLKRENCDQPSTLEENFSKRVKDWKEEIHKSLLAAGVSQNTVVKVPVVPAGIDIEPHLPGRNYWLSRLWCVFVMRLKRQCQAKIIYLNETRLKPASAVKHDDFNKKGSSQPLVLDVFEGIGGISATVLRGAGIVLKGTVNLSGNALYGAASGAVTGVYLGSGGGALPIVTGAIASTGLVVSAPVTVVAGAVIGAFAGAFAGTCYYLFGKAEF